MRSSVLSFAARPVIPCHASAKARALDRAPRTPVSSGRHSTSLPATASIASAVIPLHANGYGGVCKAAPTGTPSSHTVSKIESSGNTPARSRVSSMVCTIGSRRYSGSAIARNSSTDECSLTATSPGWTPKLQESIELRPGERPRLYRFPRRFVCKHGRSRPCTQARLERRGYATPGSVSAFTTAGSPAANARSSAGRTSAGVDTSSPCPPRAVTTSS